MGQVLGEADDRLVDDDGPVGPTLADLPERTDLLVIGSRGYRFMRRILLGGVLGVLVRSAYYPVVIVPG